jgi:hypothetical protein
MLNFGDEPSFGGSSLFVIRRKPAETGLCLAIETVFRAKDVDMVRRLRWNGLLRPKGAASL